MQRCLDLKFTEQGCFCDLGINEIGKLVKIIVSCNQSEKRAGSIFFQYFLEILGYIF